MSHPRLWNRRTRPPFTGANKDVPMIARLALAAALAAPLAAFAAPAAANALQLNERLGHPN